MAISTITRATALLTDDDGTGTTGTVFNNSWYQLFCNAIDALLSSALTIGSTFRTGYTSDGNTYTQSNANLLAGNNTEAVGIAGGSTLANVNFYISSAAARKVTLQAGVGGANGGSLKIFTKTDGGADVSEKWTIFDGGGIAATGGTVATGGDKGAGTINAKAVYDDNAILTDWVFELAYRGTTERPHADRLYPLTETEQVAREECRLPWMPKEDDFETARALGGMVTRLWQGQEQQQLYIFELEQRLAALEAQRH